LLSALVVSAPLFIVEEAQAQIYKCVDGQAEVFYNDKPCPAKQIEKKIKSEKDPVNVYIPPSFSPSVEKGETKNPAKKSAGGGGNSLNSDTSSNNQAGGNMELTGDANEQNSAGSSSGGVSVSAGEGTTSNATTSNTTTTTTPATSTRKLYMH